jgi:hypothetical protein
MLSLDFDTQFNRLEARVVILAARAFCSHTPHPLLLHTLSLPTPSLTPHPLLPHTLSFPPFPSPHPSQNTKGDAYDEVIVDMSTLRIIDTDMQAQVRGQGIGLRSSKCHDPVTDDDHVNLSYQNLFGLCVCVSPSFRPVKYVEVLPCH